MDIFSNLSADLSVDEVRELIKKVAEKTTGRPVENIEFKLEARSHGFGFGEFETTEFTGVKITFGKPYPKTSHLD